MYKIVTLFAFCSFATLQAQQQAEVHFDFNKSTLTASATQKLDSLAGASTTMEVTKIYGYCDAKGSDAYNDSLSLQRIKSVYEYLLQHKMAIRNDREERGFGKRFRQSPVQADNRKVIIIYSPKETGELKRAEQNQSIVKRMKEPAVAPAPTDLTKSISEAKEGDLIKLPNLYFYNNSARVLPKSEPTLDLLLRAMQNNPTLEIAIQGHICCQPVYDVNDVSTARAKAVYDFLAEHDISRKRMSFKGFGISRPVHPIPEKSTQEEDDNRRVEILILKK